MMRVLRTLMAFDAPISFVLTYILLPLWILAGFADYLCHRLTGIEHASGPKESALHWMMLGEIGLPLVAVACLRVDALILVLCALCILAHMITTHWDLQIASHTRKVTAFEQQVHSVLEGAPVAGLMLLVVLHWPQAQALFGQGPQQADFSVAWDLPTEWYAVIALLVAAILFLAIPYADELRRGVRAQAEGRVRD